MTLDPAVERRVLDALLQPAVLVDLEGRVLAANAAAESSGLDPALVGGPFASVLDDSERGGFKEVLGLAGQGHSWSGRLHLTPLGSAAAAVAVSPVPTDGALGMALVVIDPSKDDTRVGELAERVPALAKVSAELLRATTLEAVTDIVVQHLADAAGATTASLSVMTDEQTLGLVGLRGGAVGARTKYATYPIDETTPAGLAAVTRDAVVVEGRDEIMARFPELDLAAEGERSIVCLPLIVGEHAVGVVSLSFPYFKTFEAPELDFLRLLADTCAQAVERIRAESVAADQTAKLQFLAQASIELASSLDYEATLRKVAWLAVPWFADWAAVSLEEDGRLRTIAVAHSDPRRLAVAEEFQRRYPPDPETSVSYQVLRTGESLLTPEVTDEMLEAAFTDAEQLAMIRELQLRSSLVVPLRARGRVFGTLTLATSDPGRTFGPRDLEFSEHLARRAATAIDNAHLHSELRTIAEGLQEAVRPALLPAQAAGWELAAVYQPAGRTHVGGDFYDVIRVDEHRLAVFVGDVMGRGVMAASAMAQLRAGVRTLVAVDPEPSAVMAGIDRHFQQYPTDQLVSLVCGLVDRDRSELVLVSAGHPPALVLRAGGGAEYVEAAHGMILGVLPRHRPRAVVPFGPGDTMLLYTDGLVERRSLDLEISQQHLLSLALEVLAGGPLAAGLDRLVERVGSPGGGDDVAAVAVRRT